jgi:hypothetical protein
MRFMSPLPEEWPFERIDPDEYHSLYDFEES